MRCVHHWHVATSHLRLLAGVGIVLLVLGVRVPASLLLLRGRLLRGELLVHLLVWLLCKASRRLQAVRCNQAKDWRQQWQGFLLAQ